MQGAKLNVVEKEKLIVGCGLKVSFAMYEN
jgi:hypothetical protein